MSYLVMARKWRPKNFEEMVGQEHIAKTLRNALASGRIAHAYLFTGTRGVGKTTSARILAKALNCKNGPTATPCETCENCLAVNQGNSMDVIEIDGASNNSVDDVRDLREQVKYAPMHGTYKIYIIDEVHMLSKNAFNAFLKVLEEPPPHVIFIFATTEVNKVPHTILSRVQRFDFRRISETAIRERLEFICGQEKIHPQIEALEAMARKADGSMRDALSLFDRVVAFTGEELTLEATRKVLGIPEDRLYGQLLKHLIAHDTAGCFSSLEEVYHQGLEISEFLAGLGEYLRDVLFSRQEGITPVMLGVGEARFRDLRQSALDILDGDLLRYAKIVSDLLYGLKTAPHPRLWVELGLARMAALDKVVNLSQLLGQEPLPQTRAESAPSIPAAEPEAKKKSPEPALASPTPFPTPGPTKVSVAVPEETVVSVQKAQEPAARIANPADPIPTPIKASPATSPEAKTVEGPEPLEAENDGPVSLETLPLAWLHLVEKYAEERPMTASPLRHSELRFRAEETPGIEIVFSEAAHHDLFLADGEAKRGLKTFLTGRLEGKPNFVLMFSVSEEPRDAVSAVSSSGTQTKNRAASAEKSMEALMQREPIVKTLLDMFEGRVLEDSP